MTENIYDSPTGRILLVPQGTRVIGQYDNNVQFGQSRVLLVWNRLIFPNGRSIVLERQPGADAEGFAGLQDGVDYHWWDLAKAAALSTLLGVGAELATDDNDRLIRAIRDGAQDTVNHAGQQIVQRQLQVAPTLTIRPGFPVRVIVTRDLVLDGHDRLFQFKRGRRAAAARVLGVVFVLFHSAEYPAQGHIPGGGGHAARNAPIHASGPAAGHAPRYAACNAAIRAALGVALLITRAGNRVFQSGRLHLLRCCLVRDRKSVV